MSTEAAEAQATLAMFLAAYATREERIAAVEAALEAGGARLWRDQIGQWIARLLPVERLVPEIYRDWRPVVHECMVYVSSHLSAGRLAPKIVEQMELPPATPPEFRLLRLIAEVPGLQKLGQVLARNRHLDPALRRALSQLENGIADVSSREIRRIVRRELGRRLKAYAVRIQPGVFSEASVSAVLRFTWLNPESGRRERGVFKVMKPYIPACFDEDMALLQGLAVHLASCGRKYGISFRAIPDTLAQIRRLLAHEVDFPREQKTLVEAARVYAGAPGVRVPRLIQPLSTADITAMTEERGVKITGAFRGAPALRAAAAEQAIAALIGVPFLSAEEQAIFHADPHAGNLLYDRRTRRLVLLDWALTERLSREERRHIVRLALMLLLRDAEGVRAAIEALCQPVDAGDAQIIRNCVDRFLSQLPAWRLPGSMDAMRLLDSIALEGIRFPARLAMFRKALFTLDGVLEDVAGSAVRMDLAIGRYLLAHPNETCAAVRRLFSASDWLALQWSALWFGWRWLGRMLS